MDPRIVSRGEWGSIRQAAQLSDVRLPISTVLIHHSVTAGDELAQMRQVERTHAHAGMSDVAYTVAVGQSGNVYEGRDGVLDTTVDVGGHTSGWNSKGYAICALGNFEVHEPTAELIESIRWIIAVKQYQGVLVGREALQIIPHRDAGTDGVVRPNGGKTACCGRNLINRLDELAVPWHVPETPPPVQIVATIEEDDVQIALARIRTDADGNGFTAVAGQMAGSPWFQGPFPPTDGYWAHLRFRPTLSAQNRDGQVIVTITDAPANADVPVFVPVA